MWHRTVRWIGRRSLRWFYRNLLIVGGDRIPSEGPVMLIANHPNDLPDVMLGYLSTPRDVHFIATMSAATNAMARATYRGLGVIPVTRVRDARKLLERGAAITEVNRIAYRRVIAGLRSGYLIGVFPEGGVNVGYGLGGFRPGVAQMLLQCFDDDGIEKVTVVPVGMQYESRDTPDTDVIAFCGEPIAITRELLHEPSNRVQRLTGMLRDAVGGVTRAGANESERNDIDVLTAAVGALQANRGQDGLLRAATVAADISRLVTERGESARRAVAAAHELGQTVAALGGHPTSAADLTDLRRIAESGAGATVEGRRSLALLLLSPLAAAGWILHLPLRAFIWWYALRTAESRAHRVARAFLPGLYIAFGWYFLLTALAAVLLSLSGLSSLYSLLLFMLLFRLGDLAVRWRHGFRTWRMRSRIRSLAPEIAAETRNRFAMLRDWWTSHKRVPDRPLSVQVIS